MKYHFYIEIPTYELHRTRLKKEQDKIFNYE